MIKRDYAGQDISLSGIGGVETGADAAEFILLGSDTVQVCLDLTMTALGSGNYDPIECSVGLVSVHVYTAGVHNGQDPAFLSVGTGLHRCHDTWI